MQTIMTDNVTGRPKTYVETAHIKNKSIDEAICHKLRKNMCMKRT